MKLKRTLVYSALLDFGSNLLDLTLQGSYQLSESIKYYGSAGYYGTPYLSDGFYSAGDLIVSKGLSINAALESGDPARIGDELSFAYDMALAKTLGSGL